MIVKWPGVTKPGSTCSVPVTSTDFYPTLLEMAGLPLRPKQHVDGASMVPLLKGGTSLDRAAIFWHYPHHHGSGSVPSGAVRAGDWKLIEFYEERRIELYHLADDIGESRDLAEAAPAKRRELHALLAAWRKQVGAQVPSPRPSRARATKQRKR